jgi:hypothetical protein
MAESCSGPDFYDPAAGCHPEESLRPSGGSLSGDDAYDPAAHAAYDSVVSSTSSHCRGLSLEELIVRLLRRIPGGYSGDDAYDPAAGGTPELALLPFCRHDPDR